MGLLRIGALGRVDLYLQGAMLELQSKSFAVFGGDGLASVVEFDLSGGGELHFSAPFAQNIRPVSPTLKLVDGKEPVPLVPKTASLFLQRQRSRSFAFGSG